MDKIRLKDKNFYDFSNGVHLDASEVQEMVDATTDYLLKSDEGSHYLTGTGDTLVVGMKYEDEIDIYVSQNYKEAAILEEDGEWRPVDYELENKREYLEDLSRSELIDMLLRAEYNPRKEV